MHIIEVFASAQSGFNHPFEQYANFKPSVSLKALVEEGEDPVKAAAELQKQAQDLCDQERARIEAKLRLDNDVESASREVARWKDVVASYENTIATHPAMLADASNHMDEWDRSDKKRTLETARNRIECARSELRRAMKTLAHLRPEATPIIVEADGVEQSRCTLGDFLKDNPDLIVEQAEVIEHIFSGAGYGLNLGAAGVVILRAA